MSVYNRFLTIYSYVRRHIYLAFLLGITFIISMNSTQAVPCFDSPQTAYSYLIAQEKLEIQARTQMGININRASESELTSLHGIGSSKAQAIILYREMFGNFKTIDDLEKVKGIGPKTIEKNRTRLRVQD